MAPLNGGDLDGGCRAIRLPKRERGRRIGPEVPRIDNASRAYIAICAPGLAKQKISIRGGTEVAAGARLTVANTAIGGAPLLAGLLAPGLSSVEFVVILNASDRKDVG